MENVQITSNDLKIFHEILERARDIQTIESAKQRKNESIMLKNYISDNVEYLADIFSTHPELKDKYRKDENIKKLDQYINADM